MKENFNNAVYQDEEMTISQKIELLNICHSDYSQKIWAIYDCLSSIEKAEMLWLITSAQIVILNRYKNEKV